MLEDTCIKFFQASKDSATADKRGLAVIATKLAREAAKSIVKRIHAVEASEKDKRIQMGLQICDQLYSDAVVDLDRAAKGIEVGTPGGRSDAQTYIDAAGDAPGTCETGFKEMGLKSPVVDEDAEFTREVVIAIAITHSLKVA